MTATLLSPTDDSFTTRPGFTLDHLFGTRYRITLRGGFFPGWIGSFTGRLADQGLNIISGSARKITPAIWFATFEFEAQPGIDPRRIDFLKLADDKLDRSAPKAIQLDDFQVVPNPDGCVSVHISGRDQLGLLGSLLKKFHLYMLFPNEVVVETTAGKVKDFFRLRGMGGSSPSRESLAALHDALQSMAGSA
jgi:hypothetical protein